MRYAAMKMGHLFKLHPVVMAKKSIPIAIQKYPYNIKNSSLPAPPQKKILWPYDEKVNKDLVKERIENKKKMFHKKIYKIEEVV